MERERREANVRFVPGLLGLEHRQLLTALATPTPAPTPALASSAAAPVEVTAAVVPAAPASATATSSATATATTLTSQPRVQSQVIAPTSSSSAATAANAKVTATSGAKANANTNTAQARAFRIERLPSYLQNVAPNRILPASLVTRLQADLTLIEGRFTKRADTSALDALNVQFRNTLQTANVRADNAVNLNQIMGLTLSSAGADRQAVINLQNDMLELNQITAQDGDSARIVANDYAVVTQLALGIGRPLNGYPRGPAAAGLK